MRVSENRIPAYKHDSLKDDVKNLKSMLIDARDYGCAQEDADYMRGLLEAIITETIDTRGIK